MDIIEIETRCGLIIEELVAEAFKRLDVSFVQGFQYDQDCETPDFLLNDEKQPHIVIECHQTNVRESLRMKILRLLSAVFEAKVFYGKEITSVNLLFGNVDLLSSKNLATFASFFDVSYFPEKDTEFAESIIQLERVARELSSVETLSVKNAADRIISEYSAEVDCLSRYLEKTVLSDKSKPKEDLFPVWEREKERVASLGTAPQIEGVTEYKSSILQSLLVSNDDFETLTVEKNPNNCPDDLKKQLIKTGLVSTRPTTIQKYKEFGFLEFSSSFTTFLNDPYAMDLREICKQEIDKDAALGSFFEDIRDEQRRLHIAETFIELTSLPRDKFINALLECFYNGSCFGVDHGRCWIADLMPLAVGESQNTFNRQMIASPNYHQSLRNPFSNIAIRSPRLGKTDDVIVEHISVAAEVFWNFVDEKRIDLSKIDITQLAESLFLFRKAAVIKLHKLNPLYMAVENISERLGLSATYGGVKSFVTDIASAKYDLYTITDGDKEVLLNALYKSPEYGSDHKADEWSARRRALGYRINDGRITEVSNRSAYIFVIDGTWTEKSIRKFYHAGWNYICRLWQVESILKEVFGIQ